MGSKAAVKHACPRATALFGLIFVVDCEPDYRSLSLTLSKIGRLDARNSGSYLIRINSMHD